MSERDHREEQEQQRSETEAVATRPQVWIGSLADHNNGRLHGDWIDAAVEDDELVQAAKAIVAGSHTPGAEEWAIFDHEGFGTLRIGEHEALEVVAALARGIVEHGEAFAAWAELHGCDPDMLAGFGGAYFGEYASPAAWAEELCVDLGIEELIGTLSLPGGIASHIHVDYGAIANDARLSGDIDVAHTGTGPVWIFDAR